MSLSRLAIALDIGGTNLRYAVVNESATILAKGVTETSEFEGKEAVIRRIVDAARTAVSWADTKPIAIGLALASPVDPVTGVMQMPPNILSLQGYSLIKDLEENLDIPVVAANDATLAALAEYRYGIKKTVSNMVYLTLSTGVGGGQIIDGKIYNGSRGFAAEWGHLTLNFEGYQCNCGGTGCFETYCSGPSIVRIAKKMLAETTLKSSLNKHLGGLTPEKLASAARDGDQFSIAVWDKVGRYLGVALSVILNTLDPDIIVIGGGVSSALDLMMKTAEREVKTRALYPYTNNIPVTTAKLGDEAGLIGAAALAFDNIN
ncbi:MAG: ROK family protein [Anaerolineales bacterium]|nr:ROK family protein [Anaerolineales bacterium]